MDYDELVESWINGNRSTVAAEVAKMKPSEVLALCELLMQTDVRHEMGILKRAVQRAEAE